MPIRIHYCIHCLLTIKVREKWCKIFCVSSDAIDLKIVSVLVHSQLL